MECIVQGDLIRNDSIRDLITEAVRFRNERDWAQFHTVKELAISLVVEAGELLELMQWKNGEALEMQVRAKNEAIADELGDVMHSILLLGEELGIDLEKAFVKKLRKLERKYPVRQARGRAEKYSEYRRNTEGKRRKGKRKK